MEKTSREQDEQRTRLMASQWAIDLADLKKDKKKATRKEKQRRNNNTSKSQKAPLQNNHSPIARTED